MKKIIILLSTVFLLVLGVISWKLLTSGHAKFELQDSASMYIIYPNQIETYQLEGNDLKLLNRQEMGGIDFPLGNSHKLQNRYLMLSSSAPKSYAENVTSLDFQTGTISQKATKFHDYITGSDEHHLYMAGRHLTWFDTSGKEAGQLTLPEDFSTLPSIMTDSGDLLVLYGHRYVIDKPEETRAYYLIFDKKSEKIVDEIEVPLSHQVHQGILKNGLVYHPIFTYYHGNGQQETSYDVQTFDPKTKEIGKIQLSHPHPSTIHNLGDKHLLLIEHDSYISKYPHFTLYNLETQEESYHAFPNLSDSDSPIKHIQLLDQERLLFTKDNQVIIYNFKHSEILKQTSLPSEYVAGVWLTP